MRNAMIVARFEIISLLGKPSFWILTILFPLFIVVLTVGGELMGGGNNFGGPDFAAIAAGDVSMETIGYVDEAGLIETLPPNLPPDLLRSFASEEEAQAALRAGDIGSYYTIGADVIEGGHVTLVQNDFQPFAGTADDLIEVLLNYNLIQNPDRMAIFQNPLGDLQVESLAPAAEESAANQTEPADASLAYFLPLAVAMLLFFVLVMSSSYMLRSVSREKENRTAEILLLSLRPRQLMVGKIVGLSVVALTQMVLWFGAGFLFLDQGDAILQTAGSLQLPPGFLGWAFAYIVLGYFLYASLMGALGALAPSEREGNQFSFAILLPLIIPIWFNTFLTMEPNSPISVALSLFPLTAPPSMVTRLVATNVPWWQPAVGVALLAITTYLVILLAARFFRADTLLSTSGINWQRIVQVVRRSA